MLLFDGFVFFHRHVFSLLCIALILALFHLYYFNQVRVVPSLLLLLLITSMGTGAFYSIRLQSQSEIFNASYPSAREVSLSLRITQVLAPNQSYDKLQALVQLLEPDPCLRIHPKEYIFLSVSASESLKQNWKVGSHLELKALHRFFSEADLSKSFYLNLYQNRVYSKLTHVQYLKASTPTPATPNFSRQLKQKLQFILSLGAPDRSSSPSVYQAMLLGEKEALNFPDKLRFIETGTMHLFAVSGLHIGIITLFIAQLFGLFGIRGYAVPALTLPLIFIFIESIGAPPSAVRAFTMISLYWFSLLLRKQSNAFSALVLSSIILLIVHPWHLYSLGFQLSYTVVASILLFGLPLSAWIVERTDRLAFIPEADWTLLQRLQLGLCKSLSLLFSVSLSAWIASLPIALALFDRVSTSGILANILLIHIAGLAILSGLLSIIVGLFQLTSLSEFINHAAWLLLDSIQILLSILQKIPFPAFHSNPEQSFPAFIPLIPYFFGLFLLHAYPKLLKSSLIWLPPIGLLTLTVLILILP
ncbi:MAG: ComEC/Rec2 family competence protein [Puniceicoccaceae bacterium]|nr:MAG: ComEC/Rec2 family competence protein [Puniceicoccaceae bacterium]